MPKKIRACLVGELQVKSTRPYRAENCTESEVSCKRGPCTEECLQEGYDYIIYK